MTSINTSDLLSRKNQILSEIQNLKNEIFGKEKSLELLEELINLSQTRNSLLDPSDRTVTTLKEKEQPVILTTTAMRNSESFLKEQIISFLQTQPDQASRTSKITEALGMDWGKAGQQRVSNALSKLCKTGEILVVEEIDQSGIPRQRNRLYRMKPLFT